MFKANKNQLPGQIQELFMLKANSDRRYFLRNSDFNVLRFNTIWKAFIKILWPFPVVETYTKIRRTDQIALIEDGCRNFMLCNNLL